MAIKAIQDFTQGDDFKIKIRHNPIVNISGATLELRLAKTEDTSPALSISYLVPTDTDASNGIAYIPVTAAETATVPAGSYYVSLKRILDGETTTIIRTGLYNVGKVTCFKNLGAE